MEILILKGSPNKNGSSNLLAEHFFQGAADAGHQVGYEDVAHAAIRPCIGCKKCAFSGLPCGLDYADDMLAIKQKILKADMLVFVTPLYYFGMSAQLKTSMLNSSSCFQ